MEQMFKAFAPLFAGKVVLLIFSFWLEGLEIFELLQLYSVPCATPALHFQMS